MAKFDFKQAKPVSDESFTFGPKQLEWLEALESGKYAQAHGQLRAPLYREDGTPISGAIGYCCLGVACELAKLEFRAPTADGSGGYMWDGHGSNGFMPEGSEAIIGLHSSDGGFRTPLKDQKEQKYYTSLAELNDEGDFSFPEIAAYIRQDPWNVFCTSV